MSSDRGPMPPLSLTSRRPPAPSAELTPRRETEDAEQGCDDAALPRGATTRVTDVAALRRDGRRQPPRDDLRHAVAGHRDAVEAVGGLHRALLVRDDDELRAVGEAAQDAEEAVDVEIVERG